MHCENEPILEYARPQIQISYDDNTQILEVSVSIIPDDRQLPCVAVVTQNVPSQDIGDLSVLAESILQALSTDNAAWMKSVYARRIKKRKHLWMPDLSKIVCNAVCAFVGNSHG